MCKLISECQELIVNCCTSRETAAFINTEARLVMPQASNTLGILYTTGKGVYHFYFDNDNIDTNCSGISGTWSQVLSFIACYLMFGEVTN